MNGISNFETVSGVLKKYHGRDEKICIPEGVTEIGESAFPSVNF